MTETDATKRPLTIPENFVPYLEKYRLYKVFKDMIRDLVLNLPKDHLKHMKVYLNRYRHGGQNANGIIILVSPELKAIDIQEIVNLMKKDISFAVLTRRYIIDMYEKHDEYEPGCVSTDLLSKVTKSLIMKEPIPHTGWLMFDHPCTIAEARGMQQEGVLPTVTLVVAPPPPVAPGAPVNLTTARNFFQQDFEALKFAYRSTAKEVHVLPNEGLEEIATRLYNAIRACTIGASGPSQGHLVVGAPGVYRVLLLGPRGSGRRTHAHLLAKRFGLVYLSFEGLVKEAQQGKDEVGRKLRDYGISSQLRAEIVRRRIMQKDCIDHGWVMIEYPHSSNDFENLDSMKTPPNRVIFLNADWTTCKNRLSTRGVNWCTGKLEPMGSDPRVNRNPRDLESEFEKDLDYYFSEALIELRAAAGITAIEIDAQEPQDGVFLIGSDISPRLSKFQTLTNSLRVLIKASTVYKLLIRYVDPKQFLNEKLVGVFPDTALLMENIATYNIPNDKVQTKIQAAVIAAPAYDISYCAQKRAYFTN